MILFSESFELCLWIQLIAVKIESWTHYQPSFTSNSKTRNIQTNSVTSSNTTHDVSVTTVAGFLLYYFSRNLLFRRTTVCLVFWFPQQANVLPILWFRHPWLLYSHKVQSHIFKFTVLFGLLKAWGRWFVGGKFEDVAEAAAREGRWRFYCWEAFEEISFL